MKKMEDMSKRRRRRRGEEMKRKRDEQKREKDSTRTELVLGRLREEGGGGHQLTKRGRSRGTYPLPRP